MIPMNQNDLQRCAHLAHSLLCARTHAYDLPAEQGDCLYYLEDGMVDAWEGKAHVWWFNRCRRWVEEFNLQNAEELKGFIAELGTLLESIYELVNKYKQSALVPVFEAIQQRVLS